MSALPLPIGAFGMSIDIAKVRFLCDNILCFSEKVLEKKQTPHIAHKTISEVDLIEYC